MHTLRQVADNEDILPDNGLSVAKTAFRPSADFRHSRLAAAIAGVCRTQAIGHAPARPVRPQVGMNAAKRADHELIVRLCRLPPDLAAPLLRSSLPALTPAALLSIIAATGEAHHRLIATRDNLDGRVIKALLRRGQPAALLALADNTTLAFDDEDKHALAEAAERDEALRARLMRRADTQSAHARLSPPEALSHSNLKLLKLLRASDGHGFVAEAARRLKLDAGRLNAALEQDSAVPLALAIRALGLDRAVFLDVLEDWQQAHAGKPSLNVAHRPMVLSVFAMDMDAARNRLIALAA